MVHIIRTGFTQYSGVYREHLHYMKIIKICCKLVTYIFTREPGPLNMKNDLTNRTLTRTEVRISNIIAEQ